MINTRFSGYSPDGTRRLNGGGGGILATVANIALDVFAPPVGVAMHAARGAYDLSQGNALGVVGNAFGAYGGLSGMDAGGEALSGYDAAGNFTGFGDAGMAGANGGFGDWGAAMDAGSYSLGGDLYSASDLPFNNGGTDIAPEMNSISNGQSAFQPAAQDTSTGLNQTYSPNNVPDQSAYSNGISQQSNDLSSLMTPSADTGGGALGDTNVAPLDSGGSGNTDIGSFDNGSIGSTGVDTSSGDYWDSLRRPDYLKNQAGAEGYAGTEALGGSGNSPIMGSQKLGDLFSSAQDKFMQNPIGNGIKGAGTLYSMYNQSNAANALQRAAQQQDPFAAQRGQYQQLLSQSYQDPMAIYNSAGYQGLNNIFQKQIAARDAAAGRNSQYGARQAELQNQFMNYLDSYRKGLQQSSGATIQPSNAQANLLTGSAQQYKNMGDTLMGGLNSIFGSPSNLGNG